MRLQGWLRALIMMVAVGSGGYSLAAQTVQPVISEYKAKASGKFAVTNNTLDPMTVVIEPKSFTIDQVGHGTFRPLDPGIKVEFSTMSLQLQPMQTYYVFYKATAEAFPAWFTIYSTFTQARSGSSLSVRIQLPHTVYLYQKTPLQKEGVHITSVVYSPATHKVTCDLESVGHALGRAQRVHITGPHGSEAIVPGFPLLPGMSRRLVVDWKGDDAPNAITFEFERFSLKPGIVIEGPSVAAPAAVTTAMPVPEKVLEASPAPAARVTPGS